MQLATSELGLEEMLGRLDAAIETGNDDMTYALPLRRMRVLVTLVIEYEHKLHELMQVLGASGRPVLSENIKTFLDAYSLAVASPVNAQPT